MDHAPAPIVVAARHGRALHVRRGQHVKVINPHGTQVADTWAFVADDPFEHLSMDHTRSVNSNIFAGRGTVLVTNHRRPVLTIVEDTSPGRHDTLLCPCNAAIYRELGCQGYHRSCTDNLHEALGEVSVHLPFTPASLNLFMNVPVRADGSVDRVPPASKPNDYVLLRAELDQILVFSACPQDVTPINGAERTPQDIHVEISRPTGVDR
jgi:uncharacterized protein YcgI (DUF1989 family)